MYLFRVISNWLFSEEDYICVRWSFPRNMLDLEMDDWTCGDGQMSEETM
jgi:hypothetical protein